ncbi:MAG: 1-acyl-sn-glycerol-3-phosphate acyltransferase [Clostridia bacterium]|nr:1-acyl-sn-glycerol-3-phosphate acyltransferase [Clostridia bacterium]
MKTKTYRVWRFFLWGIIRLIFLVIPHGAKNEPKVEEGPYIVCANHMSAVDPIIICDVLKRQQPRFMAKKELFSVPVLGKIIGWLGAYPVDRSGRDAGVLTKTVKMIGAGYSIGMFPQGTRRPGIHPSKTPIRNGVGLICSQTHVTVLPVFLKTSGFRRRFFHPVRVYVGKPITFDEYSEGGVFEKDYRHISEYVFYRINSLDPDYVPDSVETAGENITGAGD